MKSKYNCPVCGKVPIVKIDGVNNIIKCCTLEVRCTGFKLSVWMWKSIVKLFKKEYEWDSHGLPIIDMNIPMPKVQRAKGSGHNPPPNKDYPPPPPAPPKNRIVKEHDL